MYDLNDDLIWTKLEYSLRKQPTLAYPECECEKWYHVPALRDTHDLIDKYDSQPVLNKAFATIHQPCFKCRNEDRITDSTYAIDEFSYDEMFGNPPHSETLNLYFVGHFNSDQTT